MEDDELTTAELLERAENTEPIVLAMSYVIPFFPQHPLAIAIITKYVSEWIDGDVVKGYWLQRKAIETMTQWRGVPSLRAVWDMYLRSHPQQGER